MVSAAVIGIGVMGEHHARVFYDLPGIELVGLCDINPKIVQAISQKNNIPVFVDYQEMLDKLKPQIVSVTVPASLHEEVTIAALKSGAHVIVEKPLATTVESGIRMISLARRLNRKLMVGHIERFNPIIQTIKDQGIFHLVGDPYQVIFRRTLPYPSRIYDIGLVLDTAIHDIDISCFLIGQSPTHAFASINYHLHNSYEDTLLGLLSYQNGCEVVLDVNWISPLKTREILIYGENGLVHANLLAKNITFFQSNTKKLIPFNDHDPLQMELKSFVQSVQNDEAPAISPLESLSAVYLALTLLKSSKERAVQEISFNPDAMINEFDMLDGDPLYS